MVAPTVAPSSSAGPLPSCNRSHIDLRERARLRHRAHLMEELVLEVAVTVDEDERGVEGP